MTRALLALALILALACLAGLWALATSPRLLAGLDDERGEA